MAGRAEGQYGGTGGKLGGAGNGGARIQAWEGLGEAAGTLGRRGWGSVRKTGASAQSRGEVDGKAGRRRGDARGSCWCSAMEVAPPEMLLCGRAVVRSDGRWMRPGAQKRGDRGTEHGGWGKDPGGEENSTRQGLGVGLTGSCWWLSGGGGRGLDPNKIKRRGSGVRC